MGKRKNDTGVSGRIVAFVAGRALIPRGEFTAAFPRANAAVLALLTAMGILAPEPHRLNMARRAAKVARLAKAARP